MVHLRCIYRLLWTCITIKFYDHQQTPLVLDTLKDALIVRGNPSGVILHSDQGSVYTSYAFQKFVKESNLISSMPRRGNYWDNAVIESFHSNLKSEEFQYIKFNSVSLNVVRSHVKVYGKHYYEERIQEKLGSQTPVEFGSMAA
jgi:putative transposase